MLKIFNDRTQPFENIFSILLLAFLSILSVSGTIALRNVLLLLLLVMMVWRLMMGRAPLRVRLGRIARQIPASVYVWVAFVLTSPLWVSQFDAALLPLSGEWLQNALTWILAAGAVVILYGRQLTLWSLALASAVPVFIHLTLTVLAWGGILSGDFVNSPTLGHLFESLVGFVADPDRKFSGFAVFPISFRGIEPMHGNIGYPSSQATIFACICALSAWRQRNYRALIHSLLLIGACFASVLIASARGPVIFNIFIILAFVVIAWRISGVKGHGMSKMSVSYLLLGIAAVVCLVVAAYSIYKDDLRWKSSWDKVYIGWLIPNPVNVLCNGLPATVLYDIQTHYQSEGEEYRKTLVTGLEMQDGGRVLIFRAGLQLLWDNPRGLDGSRQSFERRMVAKCGHPPALPFSHSHNAWINLGLSLGWFGILLYACVLGSFVVSGLRLAKQVDSRWRGLALFFAALFWIMRGMTDAVFQDHYLLMQAFFLLYLHLGLVQLFGAPDE